MRAAAILAVAAICWLATPAAVAASPVSAHAMVHTCCTPPEMKERIFAEAKALGASYIRVDFELGPIFEDGWGRPAMAPDWRRFDEVLELARRHGLPVLGIVLGTPAYLSTCPQRWPDSGRCGAADPAGYGRLVGELAARAHGVVDHWEIVNEPDGPWAFEGTPEEYAHMLGASYDAIKSRVPGARVAMGGVMEPWKPAWVERVFATPGAAAARKFDIANLHLRGLAADLPGGLVRWRELLRRHGFGGPAWVTEHGYSSEPALQNDPAFLGGEPAQAAYLKRALLGLAEAGAEQVFVTLRDPVDPAYAGEGLVDIEEAPPFPARRKPAFEAVRAFGQRWAGIPALRARQREHKGAAELADGLAQAGERRIRSLKRKRAKLLGALRSKRRRAALSRRRRVQTRAEARDVLRHIHGLEDAVAGQRSKVVANLRAIGGAGTAHPGLTLSAAGVRS